jgi:hypothetical protein
MRAVFLGTLLGYLALFAVSLAMLQGSRWRDMSLQARVRSEAEAGPGKAGKGKLARETSMPATAAGVGAASPLAEPSAQ